MGRAGHLVVGEGEGEGEEGALEGGMRGKGGSGGKFGGGLGDTDTVRRYKSRKEAVDNENLRN